MEKWGGRERERERRGRGRRGREGRGRSGEITGRKGGGGEGGRERGREGERGRGREGGRERFLCWFLYYLQYYYDYFLILFLYFIIYVGEGVVFLSSLAPNLEKLDVSGSLETFMRVGDDALIGFVIVVVVVVVVVVVKNNDPFPFLFFRLGENCPKLKSLKVGGCSWITRYFHLLENICVFTKIFSIFFIYHYYQQQ